MFAIGVGIFFVFPIIVIICKAEPNKEKKIKEAEKAFSGSSLKKNIMKNIRKIFQQQTWKR